MFRYDAKKLFVSFSSRCDDKEWLVDIVLKLNREDDYGVRDSLIDCAVEYLPEPAISTLIERFQIAAGKETDEYKKRHWLSLVGSLARQIKDAPLFEKTRIASWGTLSTAACVDIARVYLESSDALRRFPGWIGFLRRIPFKRTNATNYCSKSMAGLEILKNKPKSPGGCLEAIVALTLWRNCSLSLVKTRKNR